MKKYEIIISDLDGTLIKTISGEIFPKGVWDMQLRFDVLDKIKEINPLYILIASNQGGVEKGFVNEDDLCIKLDYIRLAIEKYCNCACFYDYCPSANESNPNRKPNTRMITNLCRAYVAENPEPFKSTMLMIGDASGKPGQFSDTDKKTAENFGCDYMDVEDFIKL